MFENVSTVSCKLVQTLKSIGALASTQRRCYFAFASLRKYDDFKIDDKVDYDDYGNGDDDDDVDGDGDDND